jgi:hypothetical protein
MARLGLFSFLGDERGRRWFVSTTSVKTVIQTGFRGIRKDGQPDETTGKNGPIIF